MFFVRYPYISELLVFIAGNILIWFLSIDPDVKKWVFVYFTFFTLAFDLFFLKSPWFERFRREKLRG